MKRIIIYFLLILSAVATYAQPAAVQNVRKSVFQLKSYNAKGDIIATANGFFINDNGDAVSLWTPFNGAHRATIEDADGNTHPVETIYGANELYDVCKFHVNMKSRQPVLASKPASNGTKAWIVGKGSTARNCGIKSTESFFGKYCYYLLDCSIDQMLDGCPVVNQNGQVLGVAKSGVNHGSATAIDINFATSFQMENAILANDATLRSTNIRIAYPDDKEQALAVLLLAGQRSDSITRIAYIKDFIGKFPSEIEGYSTLAEEELKSQNFQRADDIIKQAFAKVKNKDEVHAALSKLIYQKHAYFPNQPFAEWTLDKALEEAHAAYRIQPLLPYRHQEAQLLFAKGNYQTAYDKFMELTKTEIRSGELFYEASQCKQALQAPSTEYIALLDSAIQVEGTTSGTYLPPYLLARADAWNQSGDYRKAVADYNLYDSIMGGRPLISDFYLVRSQCEMQIHQYQQALNDINRAIIVDRANYLLWAQKASLHLRFKQYEEAIRSADACLLIEEQNLDALLIKGIALCQTKRKKEGLPLLERVRQLGDSRADEYIKKFK